MNYIIVDLEWNQPDNTTKNLTVDDIPFEIIEIGAIKLDSEMKYADSFHSLIKPVIYPDINAYTREVTSLTSEDFQNEKTFPDSAADFLNWCGSDFIFCTWGSMDLTELQRNMHHYHMDLLPFPVRFYDIQKIFSIVYEDGKSRKSLEAAVDMLNLPKKRGFHRALDDAWYTADIFRVLDIEIVRSYYSIDTYQIPDSRQNEIFVLFNNYSKYISRGFDSKTDVMSDKTVVSTPCLICGRKLKKKIRWFSSNSKIYYCLCICPDHGLVKGKIRMKKTDDGRYFAVRTLKFTDKDGADKIYDRRDYIREKRRKKNKTD